LIAHLNWEIQLHYLLLTRRSRSLQSGLVAPLDLEILVLVYREDSTWYGARLARCLDVSSARISRRLALLRSLGFVERQPLHGTTAVVRATPRGRAALLDLLGDCLPADAAIELNRQQRDAVEVAAEIAVRLCGVMPSHAVMNWLRSRRFGGRPPIDLIARGELGKLDDILRELERRQAVS
jgi:DNA-binding MarR family transcriptional regulator